MRECRSCRVMVRGDKRICPLCNLPLSQRDQTQIHEDHFVSNGDHTDFFPRVAQRLSKSYAWRWLLFASIAAIAVAYAIDTLYPARVHWFRLVLVGVLTMWVVFLTVIRKRHNISKSIVWQLTLLSLLSVLWDQVTGWRGWSLNVAIPLIILGAQLALFISSRVMKLQAGDYIVYFVLASILGLVPAVFLLTELITFTLLATSAIIVSLLFLSYILIFHWTVLYGEISKRMHL